MKIFEDMAIFVEVARANSFRRAAEVLNMPNSTVSRRIAELEKAIGLRLFNRTTRRIELTEGGQVYYQRCRGIVEEARLAHEQLTEMLEKPTGLIRVSLPPDFGAVFLVSILADFVTEYPGISFDLDMTPRRADLVSDSVDVAIRMGMPHEPNLIIRQIAILTTGLYASPGYLEKHGLPVQPDDLLSHQCLRLPGAVWSLSSAGGKNTVSLPVQGRFTANNVGMLRRLALYDMGIALVADEIVRLDVERGRLVRVLDGWLSPAVPVHAVTETRLLPAKIRLFINFLAARLAKEKNE